MNTKIVRDSVGDWLEFAGNRDGCYRLTGSYTVEAAMLMTMLLPILITTLYMTAFLTDCVRMSAVMAEGTLQIRQDETEGKAWLRDQGGFFSLHTASIKCSRSSSKVTADADETPALARYGGRFEASFSCAVRRPVAWVRRIRCLQSLKEGAE